MKDDLRTMVLGLISHGSYPKKEGDMRKTRDAGPYGVVEMINLGKDGTHFTFTKFNRLFVMDAKGVVVERVAPPAVAQEPDTTPKDTFEELLVGYVRDDNFPDKEGESITMEYGEDERICLLTRLQRGVVAEFIQDEKKLYYDFAKHSVRPYIEPTSSPRRDARLIRERERVEKEGQPHEMVEQLGYNGKPELVDKHHFCNKFICSCGNVRWVANSDLFQVKRCKPCQRLRSKGKIRG